MTRETAIKLFNQKQVRCHWDDDQEKYYFSVVDVVGVLTESENPQVYWRVLKKRLLEEGNETVTNCNALKMPAADGKMRLTDVADTEQLFRLIQSIPSPKAEPFKLWLAKVGRERIDEIEDPEIGIDRLMETYLRKGYSKEWINQRLKSIEVRKELTDEWENRGVKKENLRDHMTNLELVLNMLAEASTTEISREKEPVTFDENRDVARKGGNVAKAARLKLEQTTGKKVVTKINAKQIDISLPESGDEK